MADWPYNTKTWRKLRAAKLSRDPLCHVCTRRGRPAAANVVDHIKAINAGGEAFPPLDELMSLCARCHNDKTNAVDRPDREATGRRFKGFDADGNPIDDADGWYGGGSNH